MSKVIQFGKKKYEDKVIENLPEGWPRDKERIQQIKSEIRQLVYSQLTRMDEIDETVLNAMAVAMCLAIQDIRDYAKQHSVEPTPDWLLSIYMQNRDED